MSWTSQSTSWSPAGPGLVESGSLCVAGPVVHHHLATAVVVQCVKETGACKVSFSWQCTIVSRPTWPCKVMCAGAKRSHAHGSGTGPHGWAFY